MPKRSSRTKVNNNSIENNDANMNAKDSSKRRPETSSAARKQSATGPVLPPQALESYYGPNELKRQIADALRETSLKSKTKKDQKNRGNFPNSLMGGGKKSSGDTLEEKTNAKNNCDDVPKKMIYADAVRNSLAKRGECAMMKRAMDSEFVPEKQDMEKSLVSLNEESQSSEKVEKSRGCLRDGDLEPNDPSTSTLSNLLANMDPDILQELEMDDTTWEVISIDDWSQCGSDIDEQFHLLGRDDPSATPSPAPATTNDSTSTHDVTKKHDVPELPTRKVEDCIPASTMAPVTSSSAVTSAPSVTSSSSVTSPPGGVLPLKKKKVVVTRKYIGGVDLAEKLLSLGFQAVEGDTDASDDGAEQRWSGVYRTAGVMVSSRRRCGLQVVSVRAESEALLLGLTALQGLIEDTGLLSYANCSLPSLLQQRN